ncbi:WAP domain-containing protein [Caerostris extrusa]|uniref:WAP domain-containing protein n=1 Tax=Caerostris extrusa TaxID=172846 RepID=A0AAV4RHV8_CAEEX|nr:WAP domain-containing protein [Caerostris extrusa]
MLSLVSFTSGIAMWIGLFVLSLFVGQVVPQNKPFPFGPRRRVLPGQRSSGCSDCAAELKQCILTCVEKFDCSEMNVKGKLPFCRTKLTAMDSAWFLLHSLDNC